MTLESSRWSCRRAGHPAPFRLRPMGFIKRMRLTATVWGKGSQFAAAMVRGVQIPAIAVPDQQKGQDA